MKPGSVAIVGAAETDAVGILPGHSQIRLHAEAARNAMLDAQIDLDAIDGIAGSGASVDVAFQLGIQPTWVDTTAVGGTSFLLHVRHAAAAIMAGLARTVLITHGESGRSRNGAPRYVPDPSGMIAQYEMPYGVYLPNTMFTVPALRFMKERNVTPEQLAAVAVAQRRWSSQVPRAMKRDPLTVDDVLGSRYVVYPFHSAEICLVTDGGALSSSPRRSVRASSRPSRSTFSAPGRRATRPSFRSCPTSRRVARSCGQARPRGRSRALPRATSTT
jgi:acetyl-CoA acetyltransferase